MSSSLLGGVWPLFMHPVSRASGENDVGHYAPFVSFHVSEPAAHSPDLFDDPTKPVSSSVGHARPQEHHDVRQPSVDGRGKPGGLGQVGLGAGAVEPPKPVPDIPRIAGRQELAQELFAAPRGADLVGQIAGWPGRS